MTAIIAESIDLEPSQTTGTNPANGNPVAFASSEDLRSYSYYRTRYGFATGVDYNIKPGTSVYLKGLYSDLHDFGETWVYTPNAGNTIKSVNGSQITFDNAQDCVAVNQAADAVTPNSNPARLVPIHIGTTSAVPISKSLAS